MALCYADDYIDASEGVNLEISESNPSISIKNEESDQFFIKFEMEMTSPIEGEEEELEFEFVRVDRRENFTFWAKCPRFEEGNLSGERISMMLTTAGVPRHKQSVMIDIISDRADKMANADRYRAKKVLPIKVFISVVACSCYQQ